MDILTRIRTRWGPQSTQQQSWAKDEELGALVQHLTFAAMPAGDIGYYPVLNELYATYSIRAWDFMSHNDRTQHFHPFVFRSWRGHRYILPDAVVGCCGDTFSQHGHEILGDLKAAEWMMEHGTNQVRLAYNYP